MDLGTKPNYPEAATAVPLADKDTVVYPSVTIEKKLGEYEVGDEFTATVKFRVRALSQGSEYSADDPTRHRCTLEMLAMDAIKTKGQGLPKHG